MQLTIIAGARPNFMKIAPLIHAINSANLFKSQELGVDKEGVVGGDSRNLRSMVSFRLVHTGQHYDAKMSDTFFDELGIPTPNVNLGIGGGTQAEQTAGIMMAFEKELLAHPADWVIVVGDVTSTMACAIVAKKMQTKVIHIEAGIRSWDTTMPEEINRMVTDSITDLFFTTSETANTNLKSMGVSEGKIHFVGNVMIDTLLANINRLKKPAFFDEYQFKKEAYFVLTLHRPANVDGIDHLRKVIVEIVDNVQGLPVVFPIHPRTAKIFDELGLAPSNLYLVNPLGYLEFNWLVKHAKAVITDSGGITEETTVMGVPCITLRDNTERPETITIGTNELIGTDPKSIKPTLQKLFLGGWKSGGIPELWDGKAAERIITILSKDHNN